MKHLKPAMISLCFALVATVVVDAEAGRIKMPPKGARTEKTEEEMLPRRFENHPPMMFMKGTLSRDAYSGWKIGDTPLHLSNRCVITLEGSEEGMLQEGAEAVVMGTMVGGAISARTVNVSQPMFMKSNAAPRGVAKKPGPNPNVGELTKQPE